MRWLVGLVVAALAGAPAPGRAQDALPGGFALLGLEDVVVGVGARVDQGDVAANRGTVRLAAGARVAGAVAAETIRVAPGASAGSLRCRLVVGRRRFACEPLAGPVVDVRLLPIVQVLPGAAAVRVPPKGRTAPLPAGAYGAVRVGAKGMLVLAGGSYELRRVSVGSGGRIVCAAACRLSVQDGVVLQPRAQLGPVPPLEPGAVRVDIESRRGLVARPRARVAAAAYAPVGDVRLGAGGRHAGSFVARRVVLGSRARLGTAGR